MKTRILTQAEKQHNANRLHDAFIAASIRPLLVESTPESSTFTFDDAITTQEIEQVISNYVYTAPSPLADLQQLAQNFRSAVNSASTVVQLKSALTNELMLLLREIARYQVKDL